MILAPLISLYGVEISFIYNMIIYKWCKYSLCNKEDQLIFISCVIRLYIEPKNLLDLSKYDQRRQIGFDFTNCNVFLIATQTTFVWFLNDMQIKPKA